MVPGANSPDLTIDPVRRTDAGEYRLVYTYNNVVARSDPANLSVAFRIVNTTRRGEIELSFLVPEGENFELEQSRDLQNWEPANLTFVREGGILRTVIPRVEDRMFYRPAGEEPDP